MNQLTAGRPHPVFIDIDKFHMDFLIYPLWSWLLQFAIEHGPVESSWVFPLKVVDLSETFRTCLPEGICWMSYEFLWRQMQEPKSCTSCDTWSILGMTFGPVSIKRVSDSRNKKTIKKLWFLIFNENQKSTKNYDF